MPGFHMWWASVGLLVGASRVARVAIALEQVPGVPRRFACGGRLDLVELSNRLVQILLEPDEDVADLGGFAKL